MSASDWLLEAEWKPIEGDQRNSYQLLSTHPAGLISRDQSVCYALIVMGNRDIALSHVLMPEILTPEFVTEMIARASVEQKEDVSVYLARSPASYQRTIALNTEELIRRNCLPDQDEQKNYFFRKDERFRQFFKNHFKSITPEFINMPHDFVVINSEGEIKLFEDYQNSELGTLDEADDIDEYPYHSDDEDIEEQPLKNRTPLPNSFFNAGQVSNQRTEYNNREVLSSLPKPK